MIKTKGVVYESTKYFKRIDISNSGKKNRYEILKGYIFLNDDKNEGRFRGNQQ